MHYFVIYLIVINIYSLALMYGDKYNAKKRKWRVPEKKLFLAALLLGSPGVLLGMKLFRHKTRHYKFVIGIPLIIILQIFALYKLLQFLSTIIH
jgi:uncharacterized membrane protein YsdA (DUF1294 family)